jgi:hypothetical protein
MYGKVNKIAGAGVSAAPMAIDRHVNLSWLNSECAASRRKTLATVSRGRVVTGRP